MPYFPQEIRPDKKWVCWGKRVYELSHAKALCLGCGGGQWGCTLKFPWKNNHWNLRWSRSWKDIAQECEDWLGPKALSVVALWNEWNWMCGLITCRRQQLSFGRCAYFLLRHLAARRMPLRRSTFQDSVTIHLSGCFTFLVGGSSGSRTKPNHLREIFGKGGPTQPKIHVHSGKTYITSNGTWPRIEDV